MPHSTNCSNFFAGIVLGKFAPKKKFSYNHLLVLHISVRMSDLNCGNFFFLNDQTSGIYFFFGMCHSTLKLCTPLEYQIVYFSHMVHKIPAQLCQGHEPNDPFIFQFVSVV